MKRTVLLAAALGGVVAAPAQAAVVSTRSADRVATAMVRKPSQLIDARWMALPPRGRPAAVSSSKLVGFPRAGRTYGILSSGDATLIDNKDSSESTSSDNGGKVTRGTRDTVVLRVDMRIPRDATCLSFSFRFLSEEYDEYIDSQFNDAFLAEYGRWGWTSREGEATIRNTGNNFAFDRERKLITVNSTGDFSVTDDRARGTTYDAGTRRLRASKRVKPGKRSIYFSIFDQGDRQFDSSVVIDNLYASKRRPCTSGAALD